MIYSAFFRNLISNINQTQNTASAAYHKTAVQLADTRKYESQPDEIRSLIKLTFLVTFCYSVKEHCGFCTAAGESKLALKVIDLNLSTQIEQLCPVWILTLKYQFYCLLLLYNWIFGDITSQSTGCDIIPTSKID